MARFPVKFIAFRKIHIEKRYFSLARSELSVYR